MQSKLQNLLIRMLGARPGSIQLALLLFLELIIGLVHSQQPVSFPGVSRELAAFCSARPSLSIDLAPMIVHVKRNNSFNYKLYLINSNDFVFQTGQIVPRDDFKIHSFPVKFKSFREFLLGQPSTTTTTTDSSTLTKTFRYDNSSSESLVQVANSAFKWRDFFRLVPIDQMQLTSRTTGTRKQRHAINDADDFLPGDQLPTQPPAQPTITTTTTTRNLNELIHFDRDDQVEPLNSARKLLSAAAAAAAQTNNLNSSEAPNANANANANQINQQELILPVGSFSSFHVNLTYLVRKDFDQMEPQLVKLLVDSSHFQVSQINVISNGTLNRQLYPSNEDYNFLSHRLLRDANTRITSISQIYEDWITRNFYTIVYIQRRLEGEKRGDEEEEEEEEQFESSSLDHPKLIVTDRLIFRGSSPVLLGAEQLDYHVKASAFITEKNGLHYYLEFLTNGKFYLCAIDWTKRPFKIIDSRKFPMKQTKTMFDNEELLLCPPALCYSEQPIDELVSYGRMELPDQLQLAGHQLQPAIGRPSKQPIKFTSSSWLDEPTDDDELELPSVVPDARRPRTAPLTHRANGTGASDELLEAVRLASPGLQVRLHLRDWTWTLAPTRAHQSQLNPSQVVVVAAPAAAAAAINGSGQPSSGHHLPAPRFVYRFEWAKRNEVKVNQDTYGFVLAGHQMDASYRVFNELYLISANHLITINYTLANETVTSSQSIGDEFAGLSSTLSDPITGAFYDRYTNQVYFFKGDRYVGYDFATKKPLDDFQLASSSAHHNHHHLAESSSSSAAAAALLLRAPLVSSLPVIGILGRQHQVDGIYHDLSSDFVYVFSGMKFYTYLASQFKNGAFRAARQPSWQCINQQLVDGCRFDEAYPNPCTLDEQPRMKQTPSTEQQYDHMDKRPKSGRLIGAHQNRTMASQATGLLNANKNSTSQTMPSNFSQEQQMKLRSIAARGSLLDFLVENTLLSRGAARAVEPFLGDQFGGSGGGGGPSSPLNGTSGGSSSQERIVIYLLMAMVAITIVVTAAMIVVIISWTKWGSSPGGAGGGAAASASASVGQQPEAVAPVARQHNSQPAAGGQQTLLGPSEFQAPSNLMLSGQYLANQHQFMRRHNRHAHHQSYLARQLIGDSLATPGPPLPLGKPPSNKLSASSNKTSSSKRHSNNRQNIDSSAL